ncbi:MAG: NifU N-terminal domain-containing protein [Actinobacteria bacterium]|nr:NifU N-terminal domain-containing protein [Actinomycetota bacterium]MBW3649829.1 NifU N-terminal domain-containing protein [Actinomycetota bacterium]
MATATPSPTPNPNAMRFALDVTLPGTVSASSAEQAGDNAFVAALVGIEGVASVFGTGTFVTVTRRPGADWDPIMTAVQEAAATHL